MQDLLRDGSAEEKFDARMLEEFFERQRRIEKKLKKLNKKTKDGGGNKGGKRLNALGLFSATALGSLGANLLRKKFF